MSERENIVSAIVRIAANWQNLDYAVRQDAIDRSLEADNWFTEAAINFAVNQQMDLLSEPKLTAWQSELGWREDSCVGVLNPGNIPFVELQDFLAVVLSGQTYKGTLSKKSPALFPAFLSDLLEEYPDLRADLTDLDEILESANAIIGSGSDETMAMVADRSEAEGIPITHRWLRPNSHSVAILDGRENKDALVSLAEDVLLHEGQGCRNVSLVFAPVDMSIDPVLDAFATFRGMFSAHPNTTGTLKMQQAFLKAVETPHAFADDHQFLISRGEAEIQLPGHLRWVSYENFDEVTNWLAENRTRTQCIVSDSKMSHLIEEVQGLGTSQRPALDWKPDGMAHSSFFRHI